MTIANGVNYRTFSNKQGRPMLKNFPHGFHYELRDMSGENLPFLSFGISHLNVMFVKRSNFSS